MFQNCLQSYLNKIKDINSVKNENIFIAFISIKNTFDSKNYITRKQSNSNC